MDFLRLYQHLLPDGRAWRTTVDKRLRQFFSGLTVVPEGVKGAADSVWPDLLPASTSKISEWEREFGLPGNVVVEGDRRSRLSATWRSLVGGQSPRYIEDVLRSAGFDVYVHEWWDPSTPPQPGTPPQILDQKLCGEDLAACGEPSAVASAQSYPATRNPLLHIRREYTNAVFLVECGEAFAEAGESVALAGNSLNPRGYPLVNKIVESVPDEIVLCGEGLAACGEIDAEAGNFSGYREELKEYIVPNDPTKWPYFLYIGAETFGQIAQVDPKRREEFEGLCLKICPTQQWLGVLVEYV